MDPLCQLPDGFPLDAATAWRGPKCLCAAVAYGDSEPRVKKAIAAPDPFHTDVLARHDLWDCSIKTGETIHHGNVWHSWDEPVRVPAQAVFHDAKPAVLKEAPIDPALVLPAPVWCMVGWNAVRQLIRGAYVTHVCLVDASQTTVAHALDRALEDAASWQVPEHANPKATGLVLLSLDPVPQDAADACETVCGRLYHDCGDAVESHGWYGWYGRHVPHIAGCPFSSLTAGQVGQPAPKPKRTAKRLTQRERDVRDLGALLTDGTVVDLDLAAPAEPGEVPRAVCAERWANTAEEAYDLLPGSVWVRCPDAWSDGAPDPDAAVAVARLLLVEGALPAGARALCANACRLTPRRQEVLARLGCRPAWDFEGDPGSQPPVALRRAVPAWQGPPSELDKRASRALSANRCAKKASEAVSEGYLVRPPRWDEPAPLPFGDPSCDRAAGVPECYARHEWDALADLSCDLLLGRAPELPSGDDLGAAFLASDGVQLAGAGDPDWEAYLGEVEALCRRGSAMDGLCKVWRRALEAAGVSVWSPKGRAQVRRMAQALSMEEAARAVAAGVPARDVAATLGLTDH